MASSVRAKAALFGQLAAGSTGVGGSSSGAGSTSTYKSTAAVHLPPTSSAPIADPSISHPITAPFLPRTTVSPAGPSTWSNTASKSSEAPPHLSPATSASLSTRRKRVDAAAASAGSSPGQQEQKGSYKNEAASSPLESRPPLPPVKPFPPKISEAAPQTPFDVEFPHGDGILDAAGERVADTSLRQSSYASRIPRLSVNGRANGAVGGGGVRIVGQSGRTSREPSVWSSRSPLQRTHEEDDLSRESIYSTTSSIGVVSSAVVSKANAVSIQRVAQQPRTTRGGSPTPTTTTTTTSAAGDVPRAPSVDKGIGVRMRRKSRESATSDRRRPKSGSRTRESGAGVTAERQISVSPSVAVPTDDSTSAAEEGKRSTSTNAYGMRNRDVGPDHDARTSRQNASVEATTTPHSNDAPSYRSAAATKRDDRRLAPADVSRDTRMPNSTSTSIQRALSSASSNYSSHLSPEHSIAPWQSADSSHSLAGREGWSSSNTSDVLDPLSDAWGLGSSSASASFDNDLASMGALTFTPVSSPVEERGGNGVAAAAAGGGGKGSQSVVEQSGANGRTKATLKGGARGYDDGVDAQKRSGEGVSASGIPATQRPYTSPSSSNQQPSVSMTRSGSTKSDVMHSKDALLTQLLASMSLVDTQSFETLASLEQVDLLKRELARVERRIVDVQHKLKVQIRMRDAADKLRRAGTRPRAASNVLSPSMSCGNLPSPLGPPPTPMTKVSHQRHASTASSVGVFDSQQSEADLAAATKRVDQVSRDLMELYAEASKMRRRLLEHHARVLALRVHSLENEATEHAERRQNDEQDRRIREQKALVTEQLEQNRAQLERVEEMLKRERQERASEKEKMRKSSEEERQRLTERHRIALAESDNRVKGLEQQHESALQKEQQRFAELVGRVEDQQRQLAEREQMYHGLQQQMEQLDFETTAERNIMLERQTLFSAFEHRLERAEERLREQDDRCARMLGKAEGREEMDDLLNQIKFGANGASGKKQKTAGQDIDGLIDSLSVHIDDLEDELQRATQFRMAEGSVYASETNEAGARQSSDAGRVRELMMELESTQREADEWRTKAESAKRHLAALQRQSALSVTSTNAPLSVIGGGGGGWPGSLSNAGGGGRLRLGSIRSAAELEARVALLEKRNAALEAELAHVRDPTAPATLNESSPLHNGASFDSFNIARGGTSPQLSTMMRRPSITVSTGQEGGGDVYAQTVTTLFGLLPALPADTDDLHQLQEELETMPRNSGIDAGQSNANEVCKIVHERTRNVLFVGRSLVGRTLAMEMERRDFDEQVQLVEGEREELKAAMEDMRSGHASQLQIIEAGRTREEELQRTVHDLERALNDLRQSYAASVAASASNATAYATTGRTVERTGGSGVTPSLTALISSQAGAAVNGLNKAGGVGTLQQRRNVMPLRSTRLAAPNANAHAAAAASSSMIASLSPSSSKLSFTSSTVHSASTPATSHPAWSPANLNGNSAMVGPSVDTMPTTLAAASSSASSMSRRQTLQQSFDVGGGGGDRAPSLLGQTPRTMMLGLGTPQLMERIRQLEGEVAQSKQESKRSKADEHEKARMEQILHDCQAELEDNRREMDEIRNVESRQRIELLEELTSLTSELTEARAQLRKEQRRKQLQLQQQQQQTQLLALQPKTINA